MKYGELLKQAEKELSQAGIAEPQSDAWLLFSSCFSMNRASYFMECRSEIPEEMDAARAQFACGLQKRLERVPIQQITGRADFMGYSFFVNAHVLIPRMDTEVVVLEAWDAIRRMAKPGRTLEILDLCTGSGCIGLSLAMLCRENGIRAQVTLGDISEEALLVAEKNRACLGLTKETSVVSTDLFTGIGEKRFDLIISNPPYIPTEVVEALEPEVRDHEPHLALDGHEDGLYFYREITSLAPAHLHAGGWLFYEIGYDQGEAVSLLLLGKSLQNVRVKKDLAGLDRAVCGQLSC